MPHSKASQDTPELKYSGFMILRLPIFFIMERWCYIRVGSGRVGSGRVGSGRVRSGRVGSGEEDFKCHGRAGSP